VCEKITRGLSRLLNGGAMGGVKRTSRQEKPGGVHGGHTGKGFSVVTGGCINKPTGEKGGI